MQKAQRNIITHSIKHIISQHSSRHGLNISRIRLYRNYRSIQIESHTLSYKNLFRDIRYLSQAKTIQKVTGFFKDNDFQIGVEVLKRKSKFLRSIRLFDAYGRLSGIDIGSRLVGKNLVLAQVPIYCFLKSWIS